ncbi:MAG: glycosyltransferase [Gemmataceae bacterium]|nr:glycosyltransferase [Gemmataceae bacterium]
MAGVLHTLSFLLLAPVTLAGAYYALLAVVGLTSRRRSRQLPSGPPLRFAIVIPAHDEEDAIAETVISCGRLDYPPEQYTVFVIADNCTDRTARIASQLNCTVLERNDLTRRGKGFALAWGLEHISPLDPDAVIILDADCRLDGNALTEFAAHLTDGHDVLQANYTTSNSDASTVSYLAAVCNRLENELFYAPKSDLGLSVVLRGTGMVFSRRALACCPWSAGSIVEDSEHTVRLHEHGFAVKFIDRVRVRSPFPSSREQLAIQRTRWSGGNSRLAWIQALPLIWKGVRSRNYLLADLGWTLAVSLRSAMLMLVLMALTVTLLGRIVDEGPASRLLLCWSGGLFACCVLYFCVGAILVGLHPRHVGLLLRSPLSVVEFLGVTALATLGRGAKGWIRTPR